MVKVVLFVIILIQSVFQLFKNSSLFLSIDLIIGPQFVERCVKIKSKNVYKSKRFFLKKKGEGEGGDNGRQSSGRCWLGKNKKYF